MISRFFVLGRLSLIGVVGLILSACGASAVPGGAGKGGATGPGAGGSGSGGAGGNGGLLPPDGSAGGNTVVIDGAVVSSDAICGSATANMNQRPADVLLVLDRSGSMMCTMTDTDPGCRPARNQVDWRWNILGEGLRTVLSTASPSIQWGLKFFASPPDDSCSVDSGAEVAVGANAASAIKTQMASRGNAPGSATPTRDAINKATAYLSALQDGNPKYILLATDGEPNCTNPRNPSSTASDMPKTTEAVAAALNAGIKVYVIGVGSAVTNLKQLAEAGGTSDYYPAESADELTAALQTIAGQVASCTFSLGKVPELPEKVGVFLDKNKVPQSDTEGWSYTGSKDSVNFNGSYCEGIKSGKYKSVEVLFGCKDTEIPVVIP